MVYILKKFQVYLSFEEVMSEGAIAFLCFDKDLMKKSLGKPVLDNSGFITFVSYLSIFLVI